jgi:hypothetical protein
MIFFMIPQGFAQIDEDAVPEVVVPLYTYDNGTGSKTLEFGLDQTATDSIDTHLGEADLPPFPPAGTFECRFILPEGGFSGVLSSYKDFRNSTGYPYVGTHEHRIRYQVSSGATEYTVRWDLPPEIEGLLQDVFGGVIVNKPMMGIDSLVITNFAVDQLVMIIDYDGVIPVELSFFSANVVNNQVHLAWKTESELNNYGFDIERKSPNSEWSKIGFVHGQGTTTNPTEYSFVDTDDLSFKTYQYRLKQIDLDGTFKYSGIIEVDLAGISSYELNQNYPNPFNPNTSVRFQVPKSGAVTIKIYDMLGQEVRTLFAEEILSGTYTVDWDGLNDAGVQMGSGTYIYRMTAGDFIQSKKMVLLK